MNQKGALRGRMVRGGAVLAAAVSVVVPGRAIAENARETCFIAYERAQRFRQDHKLLASREQLRLCMETSCPAFVRNDCGKWLGEVEESTPAVLLVTQNDQKGRTDNHVAVYVDGERVADAIDGREIPVDPGPHDVRYEIDGRVVETHVVVPEGQKQFPLLVDFRDLEPPPPPAHALELAPWPEPAAANDAQSRSPPWYARLPLATYALSGVAVVGIAGFAGFGVAGNSAESCAPSCTHAQVGQIRTSYTIADVSLGVAVAAGAGALYFALTAKPEAKTDGAPKAPAAAWWLGVRPAAGGGTVATGVRF
jgi:hypothetical protein